MKKFRNPHHGLKEKKLFSALAKISAANADYGKLSQAFWANELRGSSTLLHAPTGPKTAQGVDGTQTNDQVDLFANVVTKAYDEVATFTVQAVNVFTGFAGLLHTRNREKQQDRVCDLFQTLADIRRTASRLQEELSQSLEWDNDSEEGMAIIWIHFDYAPGFMEDDKEYSYRFLDKDGRWYRGALPEDVVEDIRAAGIVDRAVIWHPNAWRYGYPSPATHQGVTTYLNEEGFETAPDFHMTLIDFGSCNADEIGIKVLLPQELVDRLKTLGGPDEQDAGKATGSLQDDMPSREVMAPMATMLIAIHR